MTTGTQHRRGAIGHRERLAVWSGAAALMLLPVVALRGLDPAAWDPPGDFVLLAILVTGVGIAIETAARVPARRAYAAGIVLALAAGLLQTWVNFAVGIIGSEDNTANWIYVGVLAVAALGAAVARLRPAGMARAMAAAAVAQILAFAVAWAAGLGFTGPITVFFAGLWLAAAWLFHRAARQPTGAAKRA